MDPGEVRARERRIANRGTGPVDEVDHAVRQPRLLQQAHEEVRGVGRRRRRLPDDRVAHQRRRRREVAADGREVEGADGEHEALQRPVLHAVPDAGRRLGLLRVDANEVVRVEAPEVDQLAGGVDLGLMHRLRLVEHRGRGERRAPRAGEQLRRADEHRDALLPRRARPLAPGLGGGGDRLLHFGGAALVDVCEHVLLAMWHHRLERVAAANVLTADHAGNLHPLRLHLLQAAFQLCALGTAGLVLADRLVERSGRPEDPVDAHAAIVC